MPSDTSVRLELPYLAAGQAQKELTHNEALIRIDAALHTSVASVGLSAPPSSPDEGQCWIVGGAPSGSWTGQAGAVACWTGSGWRFLPPVEGMHVWVEDQKLWAVRDAGAWAIGQARAAALLIGNQQIVASRLPAVPAPTGGAVVDSEARAALALIISRLSAHGLIEA
jgi:hypothetical protein